MDKKIRTFSRIPHTYTLIFLIIILMAILTYIIPSGEFDRVEDENTGKTVVVPGSYHPVDPNRQGVTDVLMAPIKGIKDAAAVVGFVLIIGGAFGIITRTEAIESGLSRAVRGLKGKDLLIIPIAMVLFGLGGTTFGMCEETLPFFMIFIPLMLALGYDSMTGFMAVFLGAATGTAASTVNPFSVGIAQALSQLAPGSGFGYRAIQFVLFMLASISFVMLYARRVKKNPEKSAVYELDKQNREHFVHHKGNADESEFTRRHALILIVFAVGLAIMVWGLIKKGWYIEEVSMIFLGIGLLSGIIAGLGQKDISESFVAGCRDFVYAAVVIGLARGILVVARDGKIIDTILNGAANTLRGLPKPLFTSIMLLIQNLIAFLVPSSSGHAALTMPIMSPLGDLIGVPRQVTVTAYQYGTGITNILTPTSGTVMAALGIARIPWDRWAKFILPLVLVLWILAALFLIAGLSMYTPIQS